MSVGDMLAVAIGQVGTKGGTKYNLAYGQSAGDAWCASFVWWCAREAGVELPVKTAYVPTLYNALKGSLVTDRREGDIVFFDFNGNGTPDHVGIVEAPYGASGCWSIEGNTSQGAAGSQTAGNGVWRRSRAKAFAYARLNVGNAPTARLQLTAGASLAFGSRGARVTVLQRMLAARGYDPGAVDGIFGRRTQQAVMAFQRDVKLVADGIAGAKTRNAINI